MIKYYTNERNVQIVIELLKANGIRKIIASPGGTNVTLVASLQHDPFFEMYSCVDERSAAYMATGLCAESGEPVAISCTGATSSRNYMPALTEAYYRKLPIVAITSTRGRCYLGHNENQQIDRSRSPKDISVMSVEVPICKDKQDEWDCMIQVNRALHAMRMHGGGPVHINLSTTYSRDYSIKKIDHVRHIKHINLYDNQWPEIPQGIRIGIFVGSHNKWSDELIDAVDAFCATNDAVVLCDYTSNYKGPYRVLFNLIDQQTESLLKSDTLDLLIHIGNVSASGYRGKDVWRVSEDGEIRDPFHKLSYVFEMREDYFFKHYIRSNVKEPHTNLVSVYKSRYETLYNSIPELPFSNIWCAKKLASELPPNCVLHVGIRNSLRAWNFFEIDDSILTYCNTGGFGIDGCVSSLIGASLHNPNKIYFGVFGDLAFFYDLNSICNRNVGNNVRILLINNGRGQEFRNHSSPAYMFGEETDSYISAGGHNGNQSRLLLKGIAESLGYRYLSANNKEEFETQYKYFVTSERKDAPMIFEVFTSTEEETKALRMISSLTIKGRLLEAIRPMVLEGSTFNRLKKLIR